MNNRRSRETPERRSQTPGSPLQDQDDHQDDQNDQDDQDGYARSLLVNQLVQYKYLDPARTCWPPTSILNL